MRGGFLFSVLFFAVQALAVAARAEEPVAPSCRSFRTSVLPTNHRLLPRGSQPPSQPDSMVQLIRAKLSDADIRKGANAEDLAALDGFYAARTQRTAMGDGDGLLNQSASRLIRNREG